MENIRKQCIEVENSFKCLLEAHMIKKDRSLSDGEVFSKLLNIHRNLYDFKEDYNNVREFLEMNKQNAYMLAGMDNTVHYIMTLLRSPNMKKREYNYYSDYYKNNPAEAIRIVADFICNIGYGFTSDYLKLNNMKKVEFDSAVSYVRMNYPQIYKMYEDKLKEIEDSKYDRYIADLKEIAKGIETGYLSDGTEFNKLEFWRLSPFKYSKGIVTDFRKFQEINPKIIMPKSDDFYNRIKRFAYATIPDKADIICQYMKENKLFTYTYVSYTEYRKLRQNCCIKVGRHDKLATKDNVFEYLYGHGDARALHSEGVITKDGVEFIIKKMQERKLPQLIEVYELLEKEYLIEFIDESHKSYSKEELNEKETKEKVEISLSPLALAIAKKKK